MEVPGVFRGLVKVPGRFDPLWSSAPPAKAMLDVASCGRPSFGHGGVTGPKSSVKQVRLDGFVELASHSQESLVECAQAIYPPGPDGACIQVNLSIVWMLVLGTTIDLSFDSIVSVEPSS